MSESATQFCLIMFIVIPFVAFGLGINERKNDDELPDVFPIMCAGFGYVIILMMTGFIFFANLFI